MQRLLCRQVVVSRATCSLRLCGSMTSMLSTARSSSSSAMAVRTPSASPPASVPPARPPLPLPPLPLPLSESLSLPLLPL